MNLIEKLSAKCGIYEITPAVAVELLERRGAKNRPLKAVVVLKYARRMLAGLWRLTGEPILLSLDGALLDGEHRLQACVMANRPFTTVVLFGKWDFKSMNQGSIRGASDALAIAFPGFANRTQVAAACALCMKHERALAREGSIYTQSHKVKNPKDHWTDFDNFEVVAWFSKNQLIGELFAKAKTLAKPGNRQSPVVPLSSASAAWFLCRGVAGTDEVVDAWFSGLLSGAGLPAGDSRLLLRQAFHNRKADPSQRNLDPVESLHYIAKAWATREDRSRRIFGVKSTEAFPFFR